MDIKTAISKIVVGRNLTEDEMVSVMTLVMEGAATPAQIGSFITGLRMKGETVDEIVGLGFQSDYKWEGEDLIDALRRRVNVLNRCQRSVGSTLQER